METLNVNDPTLENWALLILRLVLVAVFLPSGIGKFSCWSAEPSKEMPASMLTIYKILSVAEPLGALSMLLGLLTPLATIGFGILILGAMYYKIFVWKLGYSEKGGWQIDLVVLAILLAIFLMGPGAFSVDALLYREV